MSVSVNDYNLKDYYRHVVKNDIDIFKTFVEWSPKEKEEFSKLLSELKSSLYTIGETTKEKGDRLEKLVSFIIEKSYFLKVYKNVRTETNEIDEIIVISEEGKQALHKFQLSRSLIPIDSDLFLGECKNYSTKLNVTYVGKFYSLLSVTGNTFGIIFTQHGLTGRESGFRDAHGLIKVIRMIEKYKNKTDFYIIAFSLEDYEELLNGRTFFELISAKQNALQIASDYHEFLSDNKHDNEQTIKTIIDGIS